MLLYWGIFTTGFIVGAILSFIMFAAKTPQEDPDYRDRIIPGNNINAGTSATSLTSEATMIGNSL